VIADFNRSVERSVETVSFMEICSIPSASGFLNLDPRQLYFKTRQVDQKTVP